MTDTRARRWWAPALTLVERASTPGDSSHAVLTPNDGAVATSSRLRRWRAQAPFDQPDIFARRLQRARLTESQFQAVLDAAPASVADQHAVPPWVHDVEHSDTLAHEIANVSSAPRDADDNGLGPVRAFVEPFATAALGHLYRAARQIFDTHPSAPFHPMTASRLFEPTLWAQLVGRAMKVVILELNVARVRGILVGATPQERCAHFAASIRSGPLRDQIIEEYPVLARSLVTAADHWAQASCELLRHLTTDAVRLSRAFANGGELGVLTAVSGGAGDSHRHGRSVVIVEFSTGLRVVYKPRSLAVDRHFHDFVGWLNSRGQTPPLRAVQAISVDDHGWAEFVANTPCANVAELSRFYERVGALMAVLHTLNATDFHYENIIASGEHPMPIDLEALCHPHLLSATGSDEPEWLGWGALQASVLRTGVLPHRVYDNEQSRGLDMSALAGAGGQRTPNRFPVLIAAGTDEMRLERDFVELPGAQNRPALGGQPADPAAFSDRIVEGFTRTYRLLLAHRDELLAPDGPLQQFADAPIRVVLRPTRQYALILSESHHPDVMRDALERDRLIDRLWVSVPSRPELERIVEFEHADLLDGDVPLFTSRPSSRDLYTTHGPAIDDFFERSGLDSAIERILAMSESDLSRQTWVAKASLVALLPPNANEGAFTAPARPVAGNDTRTQATSEDEILDVARRIGDRLSQLALRQNRRKSWLGLTLVRDRDWAVQPVGADLYGGTIGIALYLAYLDHVAAHHESRAIALDVIDQAARRISATVDSLESGGTLPSGVLGAFGTLGGAIYAFAHLGALWQDTALLDLANRVTSALMPFVEADRHLDIIGGTAGFVMATAALERVHPGGCARAALRLAADTLVVRSERSDAGRSWTTELASTRSLTGMSHGASGMGLALSTAGQLLGDSTLVDAAIDAFRYERSTFDAEHLNWPDYRILDDAARSSAPTHMWAWCHGAPGIGLARLSLGGVGDAAVNDDLAVALESTARHGFGSNDSLCHGDLGNLELFIRWRELGHRGAWEDTVTSESNRIIGRLRAGEMRCGIPSGLETPGLMMGLAGIGYGLLRLATPQRIPSLLSLEGPRVAVSPRGHR